MLCGNLAMIAAQQRLILRHFAPKRGFDMLIKLFSTEVPRDNGTHGDPPIADTAPRNHVGVQMLCRYLHSQVFGEAHNAPPVDNLALDICQNHLNMHGLHASKASTLKTTSFTLPPLQGNDLGEHFWAIGRKAAQPWLSFANEIAVAEIPPPPTDETAPDDGIPASDWITLDSSLKAELPVQPSRFSTTPGWTKYEFLRSPNGEIVGLAEGVSVPYPDIADTALVFDVETMIHESPFPVIATAVGRLAWYSWVSPWLAQSGERHEERSHLIPLGPRDGSAHPRLVIGHHVGYDRSSVLDEYTLSSTPIRWLDTMSLHVATRGIASPQRTAWARYAKQRTQRQLDRILAEERIHSETKRELISMLDNGIVDTARLSELDLDGVEGLDELVHDTMNDTRELDMLFGAPQTTAPEASSYSTPWQDITSQNSLADVAALHCGITLDKQKRDVFTNGTPREEIWRDCRSLLYYCARDVVTTHSVFQKVWPAFQKNCPHPATTTGVFALGSTFLPVDSEWRSYQARADAQFAELNQRVVGVLCDFAQKLKEDGIRDINSSRDNRKAVRWWETDPWYSQLDWTPKRPKRISGNEPTVPTWWRDRISKFSGKLSTRNSITPLLLELRLEDGRVITLSNGKWVATDGKTTELLEYTPLTLPSLKKYSFASPHHAALEAVVNRKSPDVIDKELRALAEKARHMDKTEASNNPHLCHLNWKPVHMKRSEDEQIWWPRWYWDLVNSRTGELEVTIRTQISPLLLQIAWDEQPIYRSRTHGWVYSVPGHGDGLTFNENDGALAELVKASNERGRPIHMRKLPHANGEESNVGNPFSKGFWHYLESGRLKSMHPGAAAAEAARGALEMNAQCSYWISVRDRVDKQMVVWDGEADTRMGCGKDDAGNARGIILPQVVSMGTVTRRAIEKTWLTASNAKKNRIGSELKAMVKAPPGWAIVGADVDSEELWMCSVMGDAQFGVHGATAIGWMTLEGSKSQGTDLHSKTASILGTSRDQAKVFNYSRIYGAGIKHATQLLLKADPQMPLAEATHRAKQLYLATKGNNTHSKDFFGRKFWFGGSESFVFNKLEEIATSDDPRTPALDCGITAALSKQHLPRGKDAKLQSDYMPSRVNWVVQSSGVDYLHLLITAMDHLCKTYDIDARFMLSVHDEVRYLSREEDKLRTALALQIANLWTRAMFVFKLNMDDLPEGCAFFAAVDIDHVLRKEVDDPCVTPSQPTPIRPGESLDIGTILERTNGSLHRDSRPMEPWLGREPVKPDNETPRYQPSDQMHRCIGAEGLYYLQAQASTDINEIDVLDRRTKRLHWMEQCDHSIPVQYPRGIRNLSTQRRSYSTHAGKGSLDAFFALEKLLPRRPVRLKQPFFKRMEYRMYVRWTLYRRVLRAAKRASGDDFTPYIHREFRRHRTCVSRWKALEKCQYATRVAELLEAGVRGTLDALVEESKDALGRNPKTQKPPPQLPRPRLSGALLAPTLYNAPMLRYKPVQPIQMSMMIRARRLRRMKRMMRWNEVAETKNLIRSDLAIPNTAARGVISEDSLCELLLTSIIL